MNHNKPTRRPIWHILFGIFCFLLLAFLLYATQFVVSVFQHYEDSMTELNQIKVSLSSHPQQDDLEESLEEIYRQNVQQAALLLSGQEITSERLAAVMETQLLASGVAIFQEDGTVLHAHGDVTDDPDFLRKLSSSGSETDENGLPYRSIPLENDLHLAATFPIEVAELDDNKEVYDLQVIESLAPGMSSNLIIANQKTDRLLYGPDNINGQKLSDFLVDPQDDDPILHIMMIDDIPTVMTYVTYEDYLLLSAFDFSAVFHNLHATVMPALLGFGFLLFLLLIYTEFIRTDMGIGRLGKIHYTQIGKKRYLNTLLLRKLAGFALIGISCMICITYCIQLLIRSNEQREHAESRLSIAARLVEKNHTDQVQFEQMDRQILIETAREIKHMLTLNPTLLNEEGLNAISRLFSIDEICVLDDAGKTQAASTGLQDFMLSSSMTDDTYSFWNVISGFVDGHTQLVKNDPFSQDKDMLYAAVAGEDNEGLVLLTIPYSVFLQWRETYDTNATLKSVGLDSQSILLASNIGSTTCVFDSSNQYTGLSLDAYGLNETYLRNGYSGTHVFDGRNCLITTRSVLDWNLIYITPTDWVSASSWVFTVMAIATGLVVAIISVLPWLVVRNPGADLRTPVHKDPSASHRSHIDAVITRDGVELEENRVEYHTMKKRWRFMSASEKLSHLIRTLMLMLGCILLFFFVFRVSPGDFPLIDLILEQNWDKSLNIYAFTYVVIILSSIWFISKLLQAITLFVTGTFSRRWKTLGILISNIIRYTALIASLFFTLQNFGVDTSTLITSASVLTLVFGLGCQSFVADMVAGVFLIFEGTFRVGDIVTVDNWRGEVVEIGLRSTNVKNELGNIKVFQNSRISGAINMTRDLTYAVCDIPLPAGEPLKAYEEKLTSEFFPIARENIRSIRPPIKYEGVVAINGDSATLRISVKCLESEREQIKRELYRELKLWREQKQASSE